MEWRIFAAIVLYSCVSALHATPVLHRIISLAPHTTELVYALGQGEHLVAVSDYSDFPEQAKLLPSVASFSGLNFEKIVRLQPDLILVWRGGNKPQDIARLEQLGFAIFYSSPATLEDIPKEIESLGYRLGQPQSGLQLASQFRQRLIDIRQRYQQGKTKKAFYYMWPKPLMSIGKHAWANHLLSACGTENLFADVTTDYPEVTLEEVITRQPDVIVAATKITQKDALQFWHKYQTLNDAPVIVVDPDKLHRFTPRLLDGLEDMCKQLN